MTKIEQLLNDLQTGNEEKKDRVIFFLRNALKDRELKIFREIQGIGCNKRELQDIGDEMGLTVEEIDSLYQKSLAKLEYMMTKFTDYMVDRKEENGEVNPNLDTMLKDFPAFIKLRQEEKNPAPLRQYAQRTLAQFIYDYQNNGLQGKKIYDKLMRKLAPEYFEDIPEETVEEPLNTVFPSTFDESEPLGKAYKRTISEMISYFENTSYIPKNKKRHVISNLYFYKYLTPKEIAEKSNISVTTIIDNFLSPLFRKGTVDDISLNPVFKATLDQLLDNSIYSPADIVQNKLQLDSDDFAQFLYLFNYTVYEDQDKGQFPIIIQKGDSLRVSECLGKLYFALNEELLPISKQDLYSKLNKIVSPEKLLPGYIDMVIANNEAIATTADGLIYLKDEALKGAIYRIRRIVFNSPSHIARKEDIIDKYKLLYGGEEPKYDPRHLIKLNVFSISKGGVYQYTENGIRPETVHEFIDKYIAEHIIFNWSELLEEIKKLNPAVIESSERAYTRIKCNICSTNSNIMVLKGYESDYPQYKWNEERKMDKTNFFINQAVEILKAQPCCEMTYKAFLSQLNGIILKNGYSDHTTGTVIKKYTNEDPKLFIRENDNIKLDENVLADVSLDYIGLGYKYSDFYLGIYALAVSELKSKSDHKILRSELTSLAISRISDEIDGRIVNRAFTNRAKPEMLFVDGTGRNAYICLDMAKLATETAADKQYKVTTDDKNNQNDSTPAMVIDTTPRHDISYRQMFNWTDIVSMLKKDLRHYDKPFFYQGISSDEIVEKFHRFMSQSGNVYLNALIPQAYYELCYATVDRWSSYDYRSKIARAFESLLMDIYYQNRGVESQTKGLREIMDLAFPDYLKARKNFDRSGFYGILNDIYNDRINFAHPTTSEMPTLLSNIKAFISYMALYVYTVAKYYKG